MFSVFRQSRPGDPVCTRGTAFSGAMDPLKNNLDFKYYIRRSPRMRMSLEVMNNSAICGLHCLRNNWDFYSLECTG